MDDLIKEVRSDVKEIRQQLVEMIKHQAVMNQSLIEHERRSTNLETRMIPLEKDYTFRSKLFTLLTSGGLVAIVLKIVSVIR